MENDRKTEKTNWKPCKPTESKETGEFSFNESIDETNRCTSTVAAMAVMELPESRFPLSIWTCGVPYPFLLDFPQAIQSTPYVYGNPYMLSIILSDFVKFRTRKLQNSCSMQWFGETGLLWSSAPRVMDDHWEATDHAHFNHYVRTGFSTKFSVSLYLSLAKQLQGWHAKCGV